MQIEIEKMAGELTNYDIGAITASLALFVGYHINLYLMKPQCFGGKIPFAINMKNADIWIQKHREMSDSPTAVLAIQTLRNTTMAAVFIGGNALNFALDLGNDYTDLKDRQLQVRSLIIMALMFSSFFCWANVIRCCSTLGYLIGTMQYSEKLRREAAERDVHQTHESDKDVAEHTENTEQAKTADEVAGMELSDVAVRRADNAGKAPVVSRRTHNYTPFTFASKHSHSYNQHKKVFSIRTDTCAADDIPDIFEEGSMIMKLITVYFSFGFRLMFVAIPFAFYTAGPLALLISSACLFLFLQSYDHVRHHTVK